ncbi:MAG TPA: HAD family hydrolase [Gaiellaceae bacterium]|nr:HAD family hydrolase [Gaiellaceae bacterium]
MKVSAVVFDVGETLVDETTMWSELADLAGVPRFTLFGVIGGMAARGEHWRRGFELLGLEQPAGSAFARESLYPDAAPCLAELRGRGYRLGLAGNASRDAYARLDLDVDFAADSGLLGVEKPSPEFFVRVAAEVGRPPAEIAYVGDRVDNDVEPALAAGMVAVHVRRGPWGYLHDAPEDAIRVDSLAELPDVLP